MNGSWWKDFKRWRARNFVGKSIPDGYLYRIEYHDGRYWRTVYPRQLRFINKEAAEAEIRSMGFEPENFDENTSKPTVNWWR